MKFKSFALAAAFAGLAAAAPASANEARVEVRGGVAWASGTEEAIAGVAAGYDFDLGDNVFIGAEASADKVLANGADVVWGLSGRIGTDIVDNGKLYAIGGYSFGEGEDLPHLGAGYEHKFGSNVYGKVEYRHFFSDFVDVNAAVVGVGVSF
ncbi:MAG: outer membrane beta-barrel protein [Sphingomonadaceae bacterium]|nr:outer membrane beta-barrel protein [Sphingomonadaceae bacterium]